MKPQIIPIPEFSAAGDGAWAVCRHLHRQTPEEWCGPSGRVHDEQLDALRVPVQTHSRVKDQRPDVRDEEILRLLLLHVLKLQLRKLLQEKHTCITPAECSNHPHTNNHTVKHLSSLHNIQDRISVPSHALKGLQEERETVQAFSSGLFSYYLYTTIGFYLFIFSCFILII